MESLQLRCAPEKCYALPLGVGLVRMVPADIRQTVAGGARVLSGAHVVSGARVVNGAEKKSFDRGGPVWPLQSNAKNDRMTLQQKSI